MHRLQAGCCGLLLIFISVAHNHAMIVYQRPRFYGVEIGRAVAISCMASKQHPLASGEWYKTARYDEDVGKPGTKIEASKRIVIRSNRSSVLSIDDLRTTDSGVYFCKLNNMWGPGTELRVAKPTNRAQTLRRSRIKDGLIILQALLLAMCIAAVLLRKRRLLEKKDRIYEEPETDHIYEGLAIETCGGELYEELSPYAQVDGAEAPWERD